ncbi:MAG: hypothetical protein LBR79_06430 [Oscillospiraceae bacterium]|nr:hypothetical protein [Oscillospiraceae bacterium]
MLHLKKLNLFIWSLPAGGGEKTVKNQTFFRLCLKTVGTSSFFPRIGRREDIRPVRKLYRLQSKSTTAYEDTSREIWSRHKIVEIPSFPPRHRRGGRYYQLIWTTTEILMQSHFLSDAFFR